METEITKEMCEQLAHSLGVPVEAIHCTLDGDVVAVTVTGTLRGRSARNAARRRQRTRRIAKRIATSRSFQLSIAFAVHDAISVLEDLVRSTVELVFGAAPDAVDVTVVKTGKTSVLVALSKVEDDAGTQLTRAIAPLLHRAGLSPVTVSVVSPMREDVTDARLLRLAKILSPCSGRDIARHLAQSHRVDIAADAVHRRLDILRQKGLLVYLGDQRFALSLSGLAAVPASNRRDSSDVERVLSLARRAW